MLVIMSGKNKTRCANCSVVGAVFCFAPGFWRGFRHQIMTFYSCCAINCENNDTNRPDLIFFHFPCYSSERFVRSTPNLILLYCTVTDIEVAFCTMQYCKIWDYHGDVAEGTGLSGRWSNTWHSYEGSYCLRNVGDYIHSDPSSRPRRLVSSGTVFISLCTLIYVVILCNIVPFIFQVMGMGCKLR